MNNTIDSIRTALLGLFPALSESAKRAQRLGVAWGPTKGVAKSGKTRRGATHIQGKHFKSRGILKMKDINGEWVTINPAQYRRMHLGVKKAKKS